MAARMIRALLLVLALLASAPSMAQAFDHGHAAFSRLLQRHVAWNAAGTATSVDYAGLQRERAALDAYLQHLSTVSNAGYGRWDTPHRQAFLINAYNAATLQLILQRYPDLGSIKELGSLLQSPWKRRFVALLGRQRSLDEIEHQLLRGAADYRDPRIHFAVNCASIGCPALRPEAYRADRLDAQLSDQTRRFLSDRSRNRFHAGKSVLHVSKIFDWYAADFDRHAAGVPAFLASNAQSLGLSPGMAIRLRQGRLPLRYLDYNWKLNKRQP
jgi:hypothetical protein